jgi:nucleolar protein TMA23
MRQSTLNQIRTKGINRGGLYGFFVKGESIAGTIDDSSENATDASIPPSGASTPPTSASDSEAPAKVVKMSDKKSKRKRQDDDESVKAKKIGRSDAKSAKVVKPGSAPKNITPSSKDQAAVARKITKLSPKKKAMYEERAALKKQSLDEYILRRIQKKSAKRETRYDEPAAPALFFTDLEGDATLPQQVATAKPIQPVLGAVEDVPVNNTSTARVKGQAVAVPEPALEDNSTNKDANADTSEVSRRKLKLHEKQKKKKAIKQAHKAVVRGKRKEKKTIKQAHKAESRAKSTSKWGPNKANSRWGKAKNLAAQGEDV